MSATEPPASNRIPEITLSALWNEQRFTAPLTTVDGRRVEIVHRGSWTHGFGPDFRDAMILLDGRELVTGSIEIHLKTGQWREHGHHVDPRYDTVILHIVLDHDGTETRRADGALVPTAALPIDDQARRELTTRAIDWTLVGGDVCAEGLTRDRPQEVRAILEHLGDIRLASKSARLEARLTDLPPGDVLFLELFDGLGFSANREPMRAVASRLPLGDLDLVLATVPANQRIDLTRGLLFGIAGFLPLSPSDANMARLSADETARAEQFWRDHGTAWHNAVLSPTSWTRGRVRPANHPTHRLAAGAAIFANADAGLVAALLTPLRNGTDPIAAIQRLATWNGESGIGSDRANSLVVNALIPFALALAEQTGDQVLSEQAALAWERLPPGESNEVTRRALQQVAGAARLTKLTARAQQGLIHLDSTLCSPRRCYECPVAQRVVGVSGVLNEATGDGR